MAALSFRGMAFAAVCITAATIAACSTDTPTAFKAPAAPKKTVYAGYLGTALTVQITPDDTSGGMGSGIAPPTTTSYARTLTAHVSGGSGGPYTYAWYQVLCTRLFKPTRNSCDLAAHRIAGANGPSITPHFGRWDWQSKFTVQVEDASQIGSEAGAATTSFEGPGEPYEGGSTGTSCWSSPYAGASDYPLYHSTVVTIDGLQTGWFRFNICDGSVEKQ